jgi:hypothetical protein
MGEGYRSEFIPVNARPAGPQIFQVGPAAATVSENFRPRLRSASTERELPRRTLTVA